MRILIMSLPGLELPAHFTMAVECTPIPAQYYIRVSPVLCGTPKVLSALVTGSGLFLGTTTDDFNPIKVGENNRTVDTVHYLFLTALLNDLFVSAMY